MPKNDVVKTSSDAALKTVEDALNMAVKAAKDGAADAKVTAGKLLPRHWPIPFAFHLHYFLCVFVWAYASGSFDRQIHASG